MNKRTTDETWARAAWRATLTRCMRSLENEIAIELAVVRAVKVRLGL